MIRLDDDILQWIDEYAEFNGVTKTKLIRDILMEKMQDDEDYLDAVTSIEESKNEPTISREEMIKRFALYDWAFNKKAEKRFSKLDKVVQKRLLAWLDNNIHNSSDPRLFGKSLEGERKTLWWYRIGKYRLIADIQDDVFLVTVVKVGKRNDIYKQGK